MQIVIDISNHDKEWITNGYYIPVEINMRISEAIANGTPLSEDHEDKVKVLEKIRSELWMEGMNMTGEYQGVWVRFRDIERIINNHIAESEE